jgi:hypothetical protein
MRRPLEESRAKPWTLPRENLVPMDFKRCNSSEGQKFQSSRRASELAGTCQLAHFGLSNFDDHLTDGEKAITFSCGGVRTVQSPGEQHLSPQPDIPPVPGRYRLVLKNVGLDVENCSRRP